MIVLFFYSLSSSECFILRQNNLGAVVRLLSCTVSVLLITCFPGSGLAYNSLLDLKWEFSVYRFFFRSFWRSIFCLEGDIRERRCLNDGNPCMGSRLHKPKIE